jgi:hypothetical protein
VKKNLLIALGVLIAIALTACAAIVLPTVVGGQSAQPSASPSAAPTPTPTPTPVEYAPLSGAEVVPGSLEHPVLMAKIDNNPEARPQVGLTRAQRSANMQAAFEVTDSSKIYGKRLILIDDVLTSGATVEAAARALLRAGAQAVDVLVFARVVTQS